MKMLSFLVLSFSVMTAHAGSLLEGQSIRDLALPSHVLSCVTSENMSAAGQSYEINCDGKMVFSLASSISNDVNLFSALIEKFAQEGFQTSCMTAPRLSAGSTYGADIACISQRPAISTK